MKSFEVFLGCALLNRDLVVHNLKRLQNFSWWTYEYGLLKNYGETDYLRREKNDIDYEIYGAGIISSRDEVRNIVSCAQDTIFLTSSRDDIIPAPYIS